MKRTIHSIIFFIVVLYCSYGYLYFFNTGATNFKPLFWHFFTIAFGLFLLIMNLPIVLSKNQTRLVIWMMVYLFSTILSFISSSQSEIEIQDLILIIETIALFYSFLIIFQYENAVQITRIALLSIVVMSVFINFSDFISPTWSKVPGRAAGLYENPTITGKMLVLMMVASIPVIPNKFRLLYCIFVGLGVLTTFSRGSWLLWIVALAGLAMVGYLKFGRKSVSFVVASLFAGVIVYSALTGGILQIMESAGLDEYLTSGTYSRLGGVDAAFSDYSTETRATAANRALDEFYQNPWFGVGLAYDQRWSIGSHNTYLRMALEGGIFRLAIFVALLVVLWRMTDDLGKVMLVIYAGSSMTSHDNLRAPALLAVLALIAVMNEYRGNKESNILGHS